MVDDLDTGPEYRGSIASAVGTGHDRVLAPLQQVLRPVAAAAPRVRFLVALVLIGLVAVVDAATGALLALSLFYLLPVALATSPDAPAQGYVAAVGAAATSVVGGLVADPSQMPIFILNGVFRFVLFAIVVTLLQRLQIALDRERDLARTDPLTELPNRRHLEDVMARELARAQRTGRPVTLAYIDLNGFKRVNDELGHAKGDEVLRVAGRTLAGSVRAADVVARLGGDEFAVLLVDVDTDGHERSIARVVAELDAALLPWRVSATVGTTRSTPGTGTVDLLLGAADQNMYEAKARRSSAGEGRAGLGPAKPTPR